MRWPFLPYRRYFEFRGRSRRTEYWAFLLWWLIVTSLLRMIDSQLFGLGSTRAGPLTWVFVLVSLIPGIAVTVRRLHDTNRTGWWVMLPFTAFFIALAAVPFDMEMHDGVSVMIGVAALLCPIALLILLAWKGTSGPNRFGEDPLYPDADLEAVFS